MKDAEESALGHFSNIFRLNVSLWPWRSKIVKITLINHIRWVSHEYNYEKSVLIMHNEMMNDDQSTRHFYLSSLTAKLGITSSERWYLYCLLGTSGGFVFIVRPLPPSKVILNWSVLANIAVTLHNNNKLTTIDNAAIAHCRTPSSSPHGAEYKEYLLELVMDRFTNIDQAAAVF